MIAIRITVLRLMVLKSRCTGYLHHWARMGMPHYAACRGAWLFDLRVAYPTHVRAVSRNISRDRRLGRYAAAHD